MPMMADRRPTKKPEILMLERDGSWLTIARFPMPVSNLSAIKAEIDAKTVWNSFGAAKLAIAAPIATPKKIGKAHTFKISASRVPFRLCPSADEIEIGIITAREVPTAIGIARSAEYPSLRKTS